MYGNEIHNLNEIAHAQMQDQRRNTDKKTVALLDS